MTGVGERMRRLSDPRSIRIGDLRVSFVPDGGIKVKARGLLPGHSETEWAAYPEYLDDQGCLTAGHGGLLVEDGDRALLIDTGYGPFTAQLPPDSPVFVSMDGGSLLKGLAKLGRDPNTVEAVAVTHLHPEHIGWAWYRPDQDQDRPVFGRAAVLLSEPEWTGRHPELGVTQEMLDALQPRVRTISDGEQIFPGVRALLLPGHTHGHLAFEITSGADGLLAFGDIMHSALQVGDPGWTAVREPDPERSIRSRRWVIDYLAETGRIGFGVHFADAVFGRIARSQIADTRAVWQPLPDEPPGHHTEPSVRRRCRRRGP